MTSTVTKRTTHQGRLYYTLYCPNFFTAWSLVCYCHNSRQCSGGSDEVTCGSPNDVCITVITLIDENELVYEYSCFSPPEHAGADIEQCLKGAQQEYRSALCCNNENQCNEHLHPPPPKLFVNTTTTQDPTTTTPAVGPTSGTGMGLDLEQVWDWDMIEAFHTFQCNKGTSLFKPYSLKFSRGI